MACLGHVFKATNHPKSFIWCHRTTPYQKTSHVGGRFGRYAPSKCQCGHTTCTTLKMQKITQGTKLKSKKKYKATIWSVLNPNFKSENDSHKNNTKAPKCPPSMGQKNYPLQNREIRHVFFEIWHDCDLRMRNMQKNMQFFMLTHPPPWAHANPQYSNRMFGTTSMVSELWVCHVACLVSEHSWTEFGAFILEFASVTNHKSGELAQFRWVSFIWWGSFGNGVLGGLFGNVNMLV